MRGMLVTASSVVQYILPLRLHLWELQAVGKVGKVARLNADSEHCAADAIG